MILHLCSDCIFCDVCDGADEYPVTGCVDFEDAYRGPEYPDGDAYQEWLSATFFDLDPVGHGEIDESTCSLE